MLGFPGGISGKKKKNTKKPCLPNAEDIRDMGSIPGSGRSPGEGNGNSLHYSCLENPMDRGDWWATVYGVTELDTTEQLSTHTHTHGLISS